MKKRIILCLLLLGIGLAGLQAQQRIKVKRLPIDTYEADYEGDAEGFEEPTGSELNIGRIGETSETANSSSNPNVNPEDLEGERSDEGSNPGCPPPSSNARVASSENCEACGAEEYRDECGNCRMLGTNPPDTDGNGTPDCLECDGGVKDLAKNCCKEKELVTAYYDEDGDGRYEKKVKVCPKTVEASSKYIPSNEGGNCEGDDSDYDEVADECDVCPNDDDTYDYNQNGIPDCLEKPTCNPNTEVNFIESGEKDINKVLPGNYGVTTIEKENLEYDYCFDGQYWGVYLKRIDVIYIIIASLFPHQQEASVAAATNANFCKMVEDLAGLGSANNLSKLQNVLWYSTDAIMAHEEVHLESLKRALVAPLQDAQDELSKIWAVSLRDMYYGAPKKIDKIERDLINKFYNNYDKFSNQDHNWWKAYAAEEDVVNPLIKDICDSRSPNVRKTCTTCP